jgi:uncharacterized protein YjbI with pentapeptide repeats
MANEEQLAILRQGLDVWNMWREEHPDVEVDLHEVDLREADLLGVNLSEANLYKADLHGANLHDASLYMANLRGANLERANLKEAYVLGTNLQDANLTRVNLERADLRGANLRGANLQWVDLTRADLRWADLEGANVQWADLFEADFRGANLRGANLKEVRLARTDLEGADLEGANLEGANLQQVRLVGTKLDQTILTGCTVYGLSVWDIEGTPQNQSSLIITPPDAPTVTVDDLEVAQFIYLLLNRAKLRNVINTITSKAVLILGRFTPDRKVVLDAMANELRKHNLLPIIFDFEGATTRDLTETIKILAGLSLFVIADITNPKSAPLELQATVPDYQIPFIPIIQEGEQPFAMFHDLPKYPWMLTPIIEYPSVEMLLQGFKQGVIDRGWAKHQEIMEQKGKEAKRQSIEGFIQNLKDQA